MHRIVLLHGIKSFLFFWLHFYFFWQTASPLRIKQNKQSLRLLWSSMRHGWGKPIMHSVISSRGKVSKVIIIGPITVLHFPEVSGTTLRYTGCCRRFEFFHPYTLPHCLHCLSGWQHVSYLSRQRPSDMTEAILPHPHLRIPLRLIYISISII